MIEKAEQKIIDAGFMAGLADCAIECKPTVTFFYKFQRVVEMGPSVGSILGLLYLIVRQHHILATVPLSTTLSDELILYASYHTSNIGLNSYCFKNIILVFNFNHFLS